MAEKHKSKYKKPKNTKYKSRKDLKDYVMDDKDGGLNPKSAGEKMPNLLRKTDKEMVDTGDMYVKYKDEDRLYTDLEDGEYDPKTALKRLKKRQDTEEKETADVLADKIENLTREQKERLVREYVRRKISKILVEQSTTDEPPAEEPPVEEPPVEDPAAAPAPDMATPAPAPAPDMAEPAPAPAPDMATPDPDTTSDASAAAATAPEVPASLDSTKFKELGNIKRIGMLSNFLKVLSDLDTDEKRSFYHKLRKYANSQYIALKPEE